MTTPTAPARASLIVLAVALAAGSARAQSMTHEARAFAPPPPSETSTGGAPIDAGALAPMKHAPKLRGSQLQSRDALHPDEIELVGLEGSETPYRADLGLARSPLAAKTDVDLEELHQRQLAVYSGARVTRLPDNVPAPKHAAPTTAAAVRERAAHARSYLLPLLVAGAVIGALCIEMRRRARR